LKEVAAIIRALPDCEAGLFIDDVDGCALQQIAGPAVGNGAFEGACDSILSPRAREYQKQAPGCPYK